VSIFEKIENNPNKDRGKGKKSPPCTGAEGCPTRQTAPTSKGRSPEALGPAHTPISKASMSENSKCCRNFILAQEVADLTSVGALSRPAVECTSFKHIPTFPLTNGKLLGNLS